MKILVIDDHALFREGLCHVLNALQDDVTILEAPDFTRAMQCLPENTDLDLVLLDLNMPGTDGFSALAAFSEQYPALPVVILSASSQRSDIQRALDAGAMGYIPKDTTSSIMLNALRIILSGSVYVPPDYAQHEAKDEQANRGNTHPLTPRQQQVLRLLVEGISNKEIATQLDLAEATVKMHVTAIFKTLGVTNRTQAAMAVEKLGLDVHSA